MSLARLLLTALASLPCAAQPAEPRMAAASALEARQDWAGAREAWERVLDTCDSTEPQRAEARAHLATLNPRVPPNEDPARANTWTLKAFILRTFDFTWTPPGETAARHVRTETTDQEIALIRQGLGAFSDLVFAYSRGQLRLALEVEVIGTPLTRVSGEGSFWLGPWDVADLIRGRYEPGKVDSVLGYVKLSDGEGNAAPAAMLGGTYGGDYGPGGAGWTGIMWYPGWLDGTGEVELHEWLHQVDWALHWRLRYPDELVPSSDDGRGEGQEGGDPEYRRRPDEATWLRFYRHIMAEHITDRMWQEARCRPWEGVRYLRDWQVLGPFAYPGELAAAADASLLPASGAPLWRDLHSPADFVDLGALGEASDHALAYAVGTVQSDADRDAILYLGGDDGLVAFLNGQEVFRTLAPQPAIADQFEAKVHLRQGTNVLSLKVLNDEGGWGFYARLGDQRGRPLPGVTP
jgi:hypothetical protein